MRLAKVLAPLVLLAGLIGLTPVTAHAVTLTARGSLNQVQVWGATPGATLLLSGGSLAQPVSGTADANGAYVFGVAPEATDDVPAGTGYTVSQGVDTSNVVDVVDLDLTDAAPADDSIYDPENQPLLPEPAYANVLTGLDETDDDGFGYITTRDGTTLSVNVLAPYNPLNPPPSPWPVVIEYSGYTPSNPDDGDGPVTALMRAAGFAVVNVNIRGTGCSGGVYSYFEPLQGLDGYDVVEAVARQPWVRQAVAAPGFDSGPDVGMVGISFSGISQLFVARTNPPSLAAITPLSVLADTYRSTLYPGGILNDGFAVDWATQREEYATPSGQAWSARRIAGTGIDAPDPVCEENQRLKLQAPPLLSRFEHRLLYQADPGDDLAPAEWVDDIDVPTFIAGSFQDEQTGGHWPTMLANFQDSTLKRAVLYNGTHADSLGPDVLRDLLEFLDLYVARRGAQQKSLLRWGGPEALADTFGEPYTLAPFHGNPNSGFPDAGHSSQTAYEALPRVRIYWERGGPDQPECGVDTGGSITTEVREPCDAVEAQGAPYGRYVEDYADWPLPGATEESWYLQPDGTLGTTASGTADDAPRGASRFTYDNSRDQVGNTDENTGSIWLKDASYHWQQPDEGDSLRYVTPAYEDARAYAGSGSVDLWVRSDATDVDLEVTLTELRPDGQEVYIQSGWLRASHRAEAPGSSPLAPRHTHLVEQPLPPDTFVPMRIELFPFSQIVRQDSRLAVTIAAPGGNRPFWHFDSLDAPGAVVDIAHSAGRPSQLNLPLVTTPAGAAADDPAPCGHLRSQPCRTVADSTRPTAVAATLDPGDAGDPATDLDRGIDVTWAAPEAGTPSAYHLVGLPSGTELADDDTDPERRIAIAVGAPPATDRAFTVRGDGEASDASADVVPPHPYTDVPRNAWNVESVDWVAAWHLADGFPDGTFRNAAPVTRAQFVSWLWTMFGRPSGSPAHGFGDVRPNAWMSAALSWAKDEGIVGGLPGNRFAPNQPINRAQIAQWLWVAAGRPDGSPPNAFADVPADAWYGPAVDWAKAAGIVAGFPGNQFRPTANATRGQAASWFLATATSINAAAG